MNLQLNVLYTYEEFLEAQRAHIKAERKQLRRGILGWAMFVGLTVMFFLVLQSRTVPPSTTAPVDEGAAGLVLPLLPWLIVFAVVWGIGSRIMRGQVRKAWDGSAHIQQPRVITITDELFTNVTALTSHAYRWPAFVQYRETANLFVLYPSRHMIEIVPKRAFPIPADSDAFRAFLQHVITPDQPAFPVLPPND